MPNPYRGKSNDNILDEDSLVKQQWSNNKVKHTFDFINDAIQKQFVTTLYINIGKARDLEEFKGNLMRDLQFNNLYVEYHTGPMNDVATSAIGWFYGIYPDACNILHKESIINAELKHQCVSNSTDISQWCKTQPSAFLQNWNCTCTNIPFVHLEIMKPQFLPRNDKRLITRAIGVKT